MPKKVTLCTLETFSTTGGIQKMTRTLAHSLHLIAGHNTWDFNLLSVYDSTRDLMPQYLPAERFRGFDKKRLKFILNTFIHGRKTDILILSHINLAFIGLLVKIINPKCSVWLIAHGIEVWRPLSPIKNAFLKRCDRIICVSAFTREEMIKRHQTPPAICEILNNAIDPFMKLPVTFIKPAHLLKKYGIDNHTPVIFTLTRLASSEQYKGYDQVIKVISRLKSKFPGITYILSGPHDPREEIRIKKLINDFCLGENVILTGFIDEAEIPGHFLLADLFVLPSKGEGFGIVFIEALACGLPVICGDADGSADAICNGELGTAVNADDLSELENAVINHLSVPLTRDKRQQLQKECLGHFNENEYINKLEKFLI